ncbi:phosphatidate cytidylyltransferase [Hymenobacter radiodurans]|uniref:phosphatidate cytidylyltransferase n=1 Tax=Hymenobacter radiodurans TaxID=2496028 RepID=UPI00105877EE|nr:phosphatidate cytidylyltransferase [Hymenobacter radiodurans]
MPPTPAPAESTLTDQPPGKKPMSNLTQRIIFGAIGAALLFGCIWYSAWSFAVFFALVQAKMLLEFYRMMRKTGYAPVAAMGVGVSVLLFMGVHLIAGAGHYNTEGNSAIQIYNADAAPGSSVAFYSFGFLIQRALLCSLVLIPVLLILREMILWPRSKNPFGNIGVNLLGLFYVSIPMSLLSVLAFTETGYDFRRVLALLFLVWTADIGAYAAGKTMGKHKLAPNISPGKTWEGWIGGALLTLVMGWALGYLLPDMPLSHRLVAAAVVAVFGVLGDLAESMLKRSVGVKDSGRILPGHGGLLDRFDALLLVLPVLVLLQLLVE